MIFLDATTRSLEFLLAAAITTTALSFVSSYVDVDQTTFGMTAASTTTGTSNNTTAVTLTAAPGASKTRQLKYLSIRNRDTLQATVKVRYNDNATTYELVAVVLDPSDTLTYLDGRGFEVINSMGSIKATPQVTSMGREYFSGTGAATAFTLAVAPPSQNAIVVAIDGVVQSPGADYTVAGTTLTFTTAPPTGTSNIHVLNMGTALAIGTPSAGTVVAASASSVTGTGNTFVMSASPTITGTLTTAAITASGVVTSTYSAGSGAFTAQPSTATNQGSFNVVNTGGIYYFGADNSTGSFFNTGVAYGCAIYSPTTVSTVIGGTAIFAVSSTGLAVTGDCMLSASAPRSTSAGFVALSGAKQTTVGAAGAASALPLTPTGYWRVDISGVEAVIPYYAKA